MLRLATVLHAHGGIRGTNTRDDVSEPYQLVCRSSCPVATMAKAVKDDDVQRQSVVQQWLAQLQCGNTVNLLLFFHKAAQGLLVPVLQAYLG